MQLLQSSVSSSFENEAMNLLSTSVQLFLAEMNIIMIVLFGLIQVEFASTVRVNGVILRGDLSENYVTAFRVLLSQDGRKRYPYTDGQESDKVRRSLIANSNLLVLKWVRLLFLQEQVIIKQIKYSNTFQI